MKPEQLTAWALNELSDEEKAQIEALLKGDAEADTLAQQTRNFCDFLTTELGGDDGGLALKPEQREQLQESAAAPLTLLPAAAEPTASAATKTTATAPAGSGGTQSARSFWRRHAVVNLSAAAAVVMGSTVLIRQQMQDENAAAETVIVQAEAARRENAPRGNEANLGFETSAPAPAQAAASPAKAKTAEELKNEAFVERLKKDPVNTDARRGMSMPEADTEANAPAIPQPLDLKVEMDRAASPVVTTTSGSTQSRLEKTAPAPATKAEGMALTATPPPAISATIGLPVNGAVNSYTGESSMGGPAADPFVASVPASAPAAAKPAAPGAPAELLAVPSAPATRGRSPFFGRLFNANNGRAEVGDRDFDDTADRVQRRGDTPGSESYTQIVENRLKDVRSEPLSTFSIDVDTASYANVRRFLNQNTLPPRDAVRVEELINYFPTEEKGPAPDAPEPFHVRVEMADCPWQSQHRLARIAIKGRELGDTRKPGNLVFLVDVSGSMNNPNKLPLVKQSLRMLTNQLGENDRVSMVTYAGGTRVELASASGMNKAEILAAIDRLNAGGGTHGSAGIRLAYEQAQKGFIKGGINRVVLCTDGDFNVGISDPTELETFITEKARGGVFLSVLGYGTGNLKDRTMETLADKGNGNYAYIDSLGEARKVLVEQMGGTLVTIAKDVKIQVEFNPTAVRSYRLIGYENRLLAKEDFNDDTKDAGEIGAGHSVTALYELVPTTLANGGESRPVVDDLKYQPQAPGAAAAPAAPAEKTDAAPVESMTVKLRYKQPEGQTSKLIEVPVIDHGKTTEAASSEFKFTTAVAGFGLLLRESSYTGQLTWDQVRTLARAGKGTDAQGYRGEFLQLIEKAAAMSAAGSVQ